MKEYRRLGKDADLPFAPLMPTVKLRRILRRRFGTALRVQHQRENRSELRKANHAVSWCHILLVRPTFFTIPPFLARSCDCHRDMILPSARSVPYVIHMRSWLAEILVGDFQVGPTPPHCEVSKHVTAPSLLGSWALSEARLP